MQHPARIFRLFIAIYLLAGCAACSTLGRARRVESVPLPKPTSVYMGIEGHMYVTLALKDGRKLPFLIDTGSRYTVLDATLAPLLGKRRGTQKIRYDFDPNTRVCGRYGAPELYLGETPLALDATVITDDLQHTIPGTPPMGILGLDCLQHYCFLLDAGKGEIRFLESGNGVRAGKLGTEELGTEALGTAFSIRIGRDGHPYIEGKFLAGGASDWMIDTGCPVDGSLTPEQYQELLKMQPALWSSNQKTRWGKMQSQAVLREGDFGSESYRNVAVLQGSASLIGLRFLARHQTLFDFPNRTIYLARRSPERWTIAAAALLPPW